MPPPRPVGRTPGRDHRKVNKLLGKSSIGIGPDLGKSSNALFLNIPDSIAKRRINSVVNYGHIGAVVTLCVEILKAKVVPPEKIGILTPYDGQYRVSLAELGKLHGRNRNLGLDQVMVRRIDAFQGREKEVIILDLTVSARIGFLSLPNRSTWA
jgi:hypothetical protein